jgi:hypothetical protein
VHLFVPFGSSAHAIAPRLDTVSYKKDWNGATTKADILTVGADYQYYAGGKANQRFYLLTGLGFASGRFEESSSYVSLSESKGALFLTFGAGVRFTPHLGIELRYQNARFMDTTSNGNGYQMTSSTTDITAPSLQASFVARF